MATIRDRYILEIDTEGGVRNMGNAAAASGRLGGALRGIGPLAAAASGALAAIGAGQFISNVTSATAAYQDLMTTLETVTGGSAQAAQAFQQIQDFATTTPFDVNSLTEAYIRLQNAGITPTNELLQTLGDAAAVSGDKVGALEAVTQLFSRSVQGGLGLEDLDRLADRGINVYGILREELNLTRQDISEFGKTAEGAAEIQEALLRGFEREYGGGMARAADNLSTSLSNLGIAANNSLVAVGEGGLAAGIQHAAEAMSSILGDSNELAASLGQTLGNAIVTATDLIVALIEQFQQGGPQVDLLKDAFAAIVEVTTAFWNASTQLYEALQPLAEIVFPALGEVLGFIAEVISTVVGGFADLVSGISETLQTAESFRDGVIGIFNTVKDSIVGTVTGLVDSVVGLFQGLYDTLWGNSIIPDLLEGILSGFRGLAPDLLGVVQTMIDSIVSLFSNLWTALTDGIGGAIDAGLERIGTAIESFRNWWSGEGEDISDTADETKSALENALNGDGLTGEAIRASADELDRLRESLETVTPLLDAHTLTLGLAAEHYNSLANNIENIRESLDDYADIVDDLNDFQDTQLDQQHDINDLYSEYNELLVNTVSQLETQNSLLESLNALNTTNNELLNNYNELIDTAADLTSDANTQLDSTGSSLENIADIWPEVNDSINTYNRSLVTFIERTQSSTDATQQLAQALERVAQASAQAQQAAESAKVAIDSAISSQNQFNALPSNVAPGTSSANPLDNLFDGFFANGGFINPGKFGIVGERGPEVVTGPANITPLSALQSEPTIVNYNIQAVDARSFKNLVARDPEFIHAVAQKGASRVPRRR